MARVRGAVEEPTRITAGTNVDELLIRWPGATRVFLRHRMACPGCLLARFETIADVCTIYQQPLPPLLAELRQEITGERAAADAADPR
jgi:hybrid cluster-associated redox disulfide protein